MKFFIPHATDEKQAEEVWAATKRFAEENLGWPIANTRIFSLSYKHDGKEYYAEVGKPDPRIGETVITILESRAYLVCTPNRGVVRGEPILVGTNEARAVTLFDTPTKPN